MEGFSQSKATYITRSASGWKTYILKEFGKREYANVVYINCDDNDDMKDMFADYDIRRIIRSLSAISGISIMPSSTLIILDEIQEINRGLSSLKYFVRKPQSIMWQLPAPCSV